MTVQVITRKGIAAPRQRAKGDPVQVRRSPISWRCSAGCGAPIRWGQQFVQTSLDLKPLERAHVACAHVPAASAEEIAEALGMPAEIVRALTGATA